MSVIVLSTLLIAVLLLPANAAVTGKPPRATSGAGMMRLKDGKPVPFPLRRAPIPPTSFSQQTHLDMKAMVRRYVDDMLTQQFKLQMDRTNLEKFLTDILIWRKTMFDTPRS